MHCYLHNLSPIATVLDLMSVDVAFYLPCTSFFTGNASLPQGPFIAAVLAQNALLRAQASAALRAARAASSKTIRASTCTHNHVPVGSRLAVKRSTGSFATGVLVGYNPATRLHCVAYGEGDRRWYDLSRTVYEVISVDVPGESPGDADGDDDSEEESDGPRA